ncbi:MAG TPA: SPFH domain-containing protein [Terriglobales bacterium]|jgi:regulator of protease activity HflC (stomatin/prohibitin superfamily)|nr:SPFH domain-containing protein [Terriglobales bacterium]
MLALKYLLMTISFGLFAVALALTAFDFSLLFQYRRLLAKGSTENLPIPRPVRWAWAAKLCAVALLPMLIAQGIVVIPSGMAGVRVSQVSGPQPGTLYPGAHFVKPLLEDVVLYDTRQQIFTAGGEEEENTEEQAATPAKSVKAKRNGILTVQAREGLPIGIATTVRYRLDANRLVFIHNNLPRNIEDELVPSVVASTFRDLIPNYTVREVFAVKREEIRRLASDEITKKLGEDGIVVNEVMLRDIQLPPEYSQGLQGLLLKEQEAERMGVETEIQAKQVKIAELQAEASKVQEVKRAEGDAGVRVLQAKAEADAMQYTLPLKQKQIEESRLEAEARKEATIKNAEAAAEAKVIDSKAETERRKLLADAEANRIRVVAAADSERLKSEAVALRQNPLLINKIMAERLSDKIQIMMVPMDGKFFLGDLLHGTPGGGAMTSQSAPAPDDPADDSATNTASR